ncbi:MAG TPA: hypothetical protein VGD78_12940 [Chthoniobacterales bacterium]
MKKIFLLSLGAFALLFATPTPSQADGVRLSIGPGAYYNQDGYSDGYYRHGPRYYHRDYRQDDGPYYVYRNGHRYRRMHRWHDDGGR